MNAVVLKKIGKPAVLKLSEVPEPIPGKGEVLVRLHFSGINYAEILSRKGLYGWAVKRPYIPGMEGSGIIEAVGEGVDPSRVGEKVMIGTKNGCYAEKVSVAQEQAIPAISHFTMEENAAFLVNYMTAWVSLFSLARLQADETVLITAAAGGVGTAAVQLASKSGCKVYGLAGNQEKVDYLKSLGARGAFNYRKEDCFEKLREINNGFDVILEMVGGEVYKESFKLLNPLGRLVVAGFAGLDLKKWNPLSWWRTWRDIPRVNLMRLAQISAAVMSSHLGYLLRDPALMRTILEDLKEFIVKKNIRPIIGKIFPFEQVAEAQAFIESRRSVGKVLLRHHYQG
jgi:NADPH2:quinone reductase